MKRALPLLLLALTSCAPLVQLAQPKEQARLARVGLSVFIDNTRGTEALTGNPKVEGDGVALVVDGNGIGLAPGNSYCLIADTDKGNRFFCNVPEVAAGKNSVPVEFVATQAGGTIVDYSAAGYHPSTGPKPVVLWGE